MASINAGKNPESKSHPTAKVVACGTPREFCQGNKSAVSAGLSKSEIMTHASHENAFSCYKRYLIKEGYTQIDSKGFAAPNGGAILVLTKRSRFGATLRGGKTGGGARFNPLHRKGNRGGVIIG